MIFLKRIQKLDIFWKKIIVFTVIIALGIPLVFFVGKSFQKRVKEFDKEEFLEGINFPEIKEEIDNLPLAELRQTKEELEAELRKLEELEKQFSTSTTSTNNQ